MEVKLKKDCTVVEDGLIGEEGDVIHVAKFEADDLVQKGLAELVGRAKSKDASKNTGKL
jgi:hypothetical protein